MHPTRDLRRLRRAALARVDRLSEHAFDAATTHPSDQRHDQLTAYCVLELYNGWYAFSRSLFLSTCQGARDGAGSRLSVASVPRAGSTQDALSHAVRRCKPGRYGNGTPPWSWIDEPSWAQSRVLLDALDEIGASNYTTVSAALSLPTAAPTLSHLATFRHFYAHRGEGTRKRALGHAASYALSPALTPTQMLNSHGVVNGSSRPQPVLMDWVDDVRSIIMLAV